MKNRELLSRMMAEYIPAVSILLFIISAVLCTSCVQKNEEKTSVGMNEKKHYRYIYNNDGTYTLSNALHNNRALTIDDVKDYVTIVSGTPITTYAICSNSLMPYFRSRNERPIGCLSEKQKDAGTSSDGENVGSYGEGVRALEKQGTDIVEICVNRAKELGLEAFITMRMNDLHFTNVSVRNPLEQSDFWLDHPEFRVGEHPGWHADGALNFANKEVREYKLNFIRELCERFNLDGLELDFMRFPVYFPFGKGKEYVDVMTDFVAGARKISDEIGASRGRPILLAVRIPSDLDYCLYKGFDIRAWIRLNLVDMITVSAFFFDNPLLPIRKFKESLGECPVPVYGNMDTGIYSLMPREPRTHGSFRASAAHLLSNGADGLYLFNYFFKDVSLMQEKGEKALPGEIICTEPDLILLSDMENLPALNGRNKLYTLGDNKVSEYELNHASPVPVTLPKGAAETLTMAVYEDIPNKTPEQVTLFLRLSKAAGIAVSFNGKELKRQQNENIVKSFRRDINLKKEEEVQVWQVPAEVLRNGNNTIIIQSNNASSIELIRVELAVGYGPPVSNGYY